MDPYVLIKQSQLDALRMTVLFLHAKGQDAVKVTVSDKWCRDKLRMKDEARFASDKKRLTQAFGGTFIVRSRRQGGLEIVVGEDPRDVVREVFEHWQQVHDHPRSKLDHKRRAKINARLAEGYEKERLLAAIDGAKNDAFLMGDNDRKRVYDDILTILRDGPQVERLEAIGQPPKKRKLSVKERLRRFNK